MVHAHLLRDLRSVRNVFTRLNNAVFTWEGTLAYFVFTAIEPLHPGNGRHKMRKIADGKYVRVGMAHHRFGWTRVGVGWGEGGIDVLTDKLDPTAV